MNANVALCSLCCELQRQLFAYIVTTLTLQSGSLGALCLHYYIDELGGSWWNRPTNRQQQMYDGKVGGEASHKVTTAVSILSLQALVND